MKRRIWQITLISLLLLLSSAVATRYDAVDAMRLDPIETQERDLTPLMEPFSAPISARAPLNYTTVITINTTEDTSGETQTRTCYFTQSPFFAASDGKCNLRRALVEASHRPMADRPILIKFNLPLTDTHYHADTQTWAIVMDADYSSSSGGEAIVVGDIDNPANPDSYITIDGDTQPGGRTTGDPKIVISSTHSFDLVGVNHNTIRNLAFQGGGGIFLNDVSGVGGSNLVEEVWVGLNAAGTEIVPGTNPDITLAGGGITIQGDGNTISGTIVTGANSGISVQGDNNIIQYNYIGTRGDTSIPADRLTCVASNLYNPAQWYGGTGIELSSGSNNIVRYNTLAGIHRPHSPTETAPPAIWTAGADNLFEHNTIGIDGLGNEVGTCGQGIFVTGQGIQVVTNTIVNAQTSFLVAESSDPTEGAIFVNDSSPLARQFTLRNNIVRDSTTKVIEYGPAIPEALRLFDPPRIVSIDGTQVVGETEAGSDCPNCLVELYLDDLDDEQDALELLTIAVIDNMTGTARFTATLDAPLPANHGIRVAATTQDDYVISDYLSGTTTLMSPAYAPDATFIHDLAPGWNLFSIDVTPSNPAITQVLSSLAGQYDLVLAFDGGPSGGGKTFDPGNPGASDLTTIDVAHGYWIHITAATTQTLTLAYEPARDDTSIQLYEGWNLVSYLPDITMVVTRALESISGDYDLVRSFDGGAKSYMPGQPQYSDLTMMEPGYAYWIKISEGAGAPILTYPGADTPVRRPAIPKSSASSADISQGAASSDFFTPTTEWVDFYGVASLSGFSAPRNARVVAYDPDGIVAGAFTVHTPPYYGFLHTYIDDPNTPGDEGIEDGDEVRFTINGRLATPSKSTVWNSGVDAKEVNLEVTMPYVATDEWADFWGTITIDGSPAPVGTIVAAYDPDSIYIGDFIVTEAGQYGFLHAYGDDGTTTSDEGADVGDALTFRAFLPLSTTPLALTPDSGTPTWQGRGNRTEVNLSGSGTIVPTPPSSVNIGGPTVGYTNEHYTFTITVDPIDVTTPLTYVIDYTDLEGAPLEATLGRNIVLKNRTWATTGTKVITVTASNDLGSAVGTHTITISDAPAPGAPTAVNIDGPTIGKTNEFYTFTITVDPVDVTTPLTYYVKYTGHEGTLGPYSLGRSIVLKNRTWANPGPKTITVTASNDAGSAFGTHTILIQDAFTVGPSGGTTIFTDTTGVTTTIEIPSGALSEETVFTYTPRITLTHPFTSGLGFIGRGFDLEASPQIGGKITVTIHYRDQDWMNAGIEDETTLRLTYWNESLSDWDDVANACGPPVPSYAPDVDRNLLIAPVCHLSEFAVVGARSEGEGEIIYLPLVTRGGG